MSRNGADQPHSGNDETVGQGRALMVIDGGTQSAPSRLQRPDAAFLVQIIASKAHMGEFRRYRRAEPGDATARYRAAAALGQGLRLTA